MSRPGRRRPVAAGGLLLLAVAGCQATAVPPTPTATAPPAPTPSPTPSPTPAPWLLLGEEAAEDVRAAVERVGFQSGLEVRVEDLAEAESTPPGGLVALVGTEQELGPILRSWPQAGMAIVVLEASDVGASGRMSLVGRDWSHDQEGFLLGAAAGLASAFGGVGLMPDDGSGAAEAFSAGFSAGVRYTCPRCRLEIVADPTQPPFGVDVVGLPPGASPPPAPPSPGSPWIVAAVAVDPGAWRERLAVELELDLAAAVATTLESLLAGGEGRAWALSLENGGLGVGMVNPQAISPGRERLLREAEARLAAGLLALGSGD